MNFHEQALQQWRDDDRQRFKRWEGLREMAERTLGVHVVLTPSSDGVYIRATHQNSGLSISLLVSAHECHYSKLDTVSLRILQAIKDVGGFDALH